MNGEDGQQDVRVNWGRTEYVSAVPISFGVCGNKTSKRVKLAKTYREQFRKGSTTVSTEIVVWTQLFHIYKATMTCS